MPSGTLKNRLYGWALPFLGQRCAWKAERGNALQAVLHKHHTVGACIQRFERGKFTECHAVGYASLEDERRPVAENTLFRTASIAKMVTALLVFRLQTLGKLSVQEPLSDFLGYQVRHPRYPDAPITLGMLLSHTSGLVDSPAYFASFDYPVPLKTLLEDPASYGQSVPGTAFAYSNFAAGLIGCLLEARFGESFESLMRRELFEPLHVEATFDPSKAAPGRTANSYRVLPPKYAFDAGRRIASAQPMDKPDPQLHYLSAAGNLYITASSLARLTLVAWQGEKGWLDEKGLRELQTPLLGWPGERGRMRHGMGLLTLDDASLSQGRLWGHQGFAYGAVNGVFFDERGNGFACLNSGASERRDGHLALLNRDLIRLWLKGEACDG